MKNFTLNLNNEHELFLLKNLFIKQFLYEINRYLDIYLNRKYNNKDEKNIIYIRKYIKKVLNFQSLNMRSLYQLHQIREKFEINYYNRERL